MVKIKFKTKLEFIGELGLSKSSFYNLIKKKNIRTTPELLTPQKENELRLALGFPPLPGFESHRAQHGVDQDRLEQHP
jgi:hypothetical protein